MTNNLLLYIITRNKQTLNYEILSKKKDLIEIPKCEMIPYRSILDRCNDLASQCFLLKHTDIFKFHFLTIDIKDSINTVYFCFAPFGLKTNNTYFIPIKHDQIYSEHIRQILNVI